MSRISRQSVVSAVIKVQAMDLKQKERLADEMFRTQPHILASFLVQRKFGVSLAKMDFLIDILFVCFQAMKESGHDWPIIGDDEQDRQMARFVASARFGDDLSKDLRDLALQQYIETHPEKELLAFVQMETTRWLQRVVPEESDKFVVMAALNFVNCIGSVSLPAQTKPVRRTRRGQSTNVPARKRRKAAGQS